MRPNRVRGLVRPACYGYVAVLVDVAGALAAQLQGDGREVFGSGLHDQLSHHAVAGVEDVIEPLAQQLLGLRHSPGYDRVELLTPRRDTQQTFSSNKVSKTTHSVSFWNMGFYIVPTRPGLSCFQAPRPACQQSIYPKSMF